MVERNISSRLKPWAVLISVFIISLVGCDFAQWGEEAPAPLIANLPARDRTIGPPPLLFLKGNPIEAATTLEFWEKRMDSIFDSMRGREEQKLSEAELSTILRLRIIDLPGKTDENIKRVLAIKRLLGFPSGISRQEVRDWFAWVRAAQPTIQRFYQSLENGTPLQWTSDEVQNAVRLISKLFSRGGKVGLNPEQVSEIIRALTASALPRIASVSLPIANIVINVVNAFCGIDSIGDAWNGLMLGACLESAENIFAGSGVWYDFQVGKIDPRENSENLLHSALKLRQALHEWFIRIAKPTRLNARYIQDLGEKLGLGRQNIEFLDWTARLKTGSSISKGTLDLSLAGVLLDRLILGDIQFLKESAGFFEKCPHTRWETCALPQSLRDNRVEDGSFLEFAIRARNPVYLSKALPFDMAAFRRILFFDSISELLVSIFDENNDAVLSDSKESLEFRNLMHAVFQAAESKGYIEALIQRLNGLDTPYESLSQGFAHLDLNGLANVSVLMAEIMPIRKVPQNTFFTSHKRELLWNKERPVSVDRIGLASALHLVAHLTRVQNAYLHPLSDWKMAANPVRARETPLKETHVDRKSVVESLPALLADHFPRIYNECMRVGFAESCGVIFTEILPSPFALNGTEITTNSLDPLTIGAVFIESMLERCDANHDEKISRNGYFRKTESQCVFYTSREVVLRLMNSKILENEASKRTLFDVASRFPLVRWSGEVAMINGKSKDIGLWSTLTIPFKRKGRYGQILRFAAKVMDPAKVNALRSGKIKSDDPGDEVIFDPNYAID